MLVYNYGTMQLCGVWAETAKLGQACGCGNIVEPIEAEIILHALDRVRYIHAFENIVSYLKHASNFRLWQHVLCL